MWVLLFTYTLSGDLTAMTDLYKTQTECESMGNEYKTLFYNATDVSWTCTPTTIK